MEDVTRLIGQTLAENWPDITIYTENQANGFVEPAFYIHRIGLTVDPEYFGYQQRRYSYQVIYFPGEVNPHTKLDRMAEAWSLKFRKIPAFSQLRNYELTVQDNTLMITFDINIRTKPVSEATKQSELNYTGGVKHGED